MSTTDNKQIFFSYGHDKNQELVFQLKETVSREGYKVWIDKDEITQRAVKPRPSGRGYKAHLNWNFCL